MTLHAILLALVALLGVRSPDTSRIVDAIEASTSDPHEAALSLVFADRESGMREHPQAYSWDARAGRSCGPWQEPCDFVKGATLAQQAKAWIYLLHEGAKSCPDAPTAPLSGGCDRGRRIADARELAASSLLKRATAKGEAP